MLEKLEKEKEELLASMKQSLVNKFERLYKEEKKKRQEAEGELTIIRGIGNNSPEMKALQKENEKLKADLARVKEDHQYDNLVHQKELKDLQKKWKEQMKRLKAKLRKYKRKLEEENSILWHQNKVLRKRYLEHMQKIFKLENKPQANERNKW